MTDHTHAALKVLHLLYRKEKDYRPVNVQCNTILMMVLEAVM